MLSVAIPVACTVITTILAIVAWWISRKDREGQAAAKEITSHIDTALHPVNDRLILLEQRTGPDSLERNRLQTLGMIREYVDPFVKLQTAMEVKVGTLWDTLPQVMAQVLHQPDPARRPVDRLLENFLDGTLTNEERIELRKYLVAIKNWEPNSGDVTVEVSPGRKVTFPVHHGEQAPAAIMLLTMDPVPSTVHGGITKK